MDAEDEYVKAPLMVEKQAAIMPSSEDQSEKYLLRRSSSQSSSSSSLNVQPTYNQNGFSKGPQNGSIRELASDEPGPHNRKVVSSPVGLSPSPVSNEDVELLGERVHCLESEKLSLMIDHNNLIREFNKRMESHLEEIRALKELNQHMSRENAELRDLSCYLDDDRQKCRKLAKEWQRFGRYTLTVMRNEVMSYQEKLTTLEVRQIELIKENGELRDLCVYLDNQRSSSSDSDDGKLKYTICKDCSALRKDDSGVDGVESSNFMLGRSKESVEYVKSLENQVQFLEREKETLHKLLMFGSSKKSRQKKKKVSFSFPDDDDSSSTTSEAGHLDYPPSFGSTESFNRANGLHEGPTLSGILRTGNSNNYPATGDGSLPNHLKLRRSSSEDPGQILSQRRNSDQVRRMNQLREKLHIAPAHRLPAVQARSSSEELLHDRYRSDSDVSAPPDSLILPNGDVLNQSTDSSVDLQSPISPPPSIMNVDNLLPVVSRNTQLKAGVLTNGIASDISKDDLTSESDSLPSPSKAPPALPSKAPPPISAKPGKPSQPPGYQRAVGMLAQESR